MPRKREKGERGVSKGFVVMWLALFGVTALLVLAPRLFGVDLFPVAVLLLAITVLTYEGKLRPALLSLGEEEGGE